MSKKLKNLFKSFNFNDNVKEKIEKEFNRIGKMKISKNSKESKFSVYVNKIINKEIIIEPENEFENEPELEPVNEKAKKSGKPLNVFIPELLANRKLKEKSLTVFSPDRDVIKLLLLKKKNNKNVLVLN